MIENYWLFESTLIFVALCHLTVYLIIPLKNILGKMICLTIFKVNDSCNKILC